MNDSNRTDSLLLSRNFSNIVKPLQHFDSISARKHSEKIVKEGNRCSSSSSSGHSSGDSSNTTITITNNYDEPSTPILNESLELELDAANAIKITHNNNRTISSTSDHLHHQLKDNRQHHHNRIMPSSIGMNLNIPNINSGGGYHDDDEDEDHQHPRKISPSGTIEICVNDCISLENNQLTKHKLTDSIEISPNDDRRQIFGRICIDAFVLCCVGLPIIYFYRWAKPYKRGFFCDDTSLKHPYKDSTIPSQLLVFMCLVVPFAMIIIIEFFNTDTRRSRDQYYIGPFRVPPFLVECYKKIGVLIFGAAVCQLTTEMAKFSIGRLRPHFFAVCQPLILDNTTCDDPINVGRYIENFDCRGGTNITDSILKNVGLSFPSGHSTYSFYNMIYLALYLQSRLTCQRKNMFVHLLQLGFILFAWYTALTRVSDYKHHWSDVLAGSVIGSTFAIIATNL